MNFTGIKNIDELLTKFGNTDTRPVGTMPTAEMEEYFIKRIRTVFREIIIG